MIRAIWMTFFLAAALMGGAQSSAPTPEAKVESFEKRMKRRLGKEEAETLYSRFIGEWRFEVPGFGTLVVKVFVADRLLWASVAGGVLGDRAEFIPVEGKPLEFTLDSTAVGVFDWEFIADAEGTVAKARFFHPGLNIRAEGVRER